VVGRSAKSDWGCGVTEFAVALAIPTYKRPEYLERVSLASAVQQKAFHGARIAVYDDGSPEPTASTVRALCARQGAIYASGEHSGPVGGLAGALRAGLAALDGVDVPVIVLAANDHRLPPAWDVLALAAAAVTYPERECGLWAHRPGNVWWRGWWPPDVLLAKGVGVSFNHAPDEVRGSMPSVIAGREAIGALAAHMEASAATAHKSPVGTWHTFRAFWRERLGPEGSPYTIIADSAGHESLIEHVGRDAHPDYIRSAEHEAYEIEIGRRKVATEHA